MLDVYHALGMSSQVLWRALPTCWSPATQHSAFLCNQRLLTQPLNRGLYPAPGLGAAASAQVSLVVSSEWRSTAYCPSSHPVRIRDPYSGVSSPLEMGQPQAWASRQAPNLQSYGSSDSPWLAAFRAGAEADCIISELRPRRKGGLDLSLRWY